VILAFAHFPCLLRRSHNRVSYDPTMGLRDQRLFQLTRYDRLDQVSQSKRNLGNFRRGNGGGYCFLLQRGQKTTGFVAPGSVVLSAERVFVSRSSLLIILGSCHRIEDLEIGQTYEPSSPKSFFHRTILFCRRGLDLCNKCSCHEARDQLKTGRREGIERNLSWSWS